MRNKIFALVLFLLLISNLSFTQSWERTFIHNTGFAKGFDVLQTSDNGYLIVGEVDLPTGAIRHYIWLVKVDNSGNLLWSRIYDGGDISDQSGRAVTEAPNGDLYIAGSNNAKASVLKTNLNGDSLWTRDFGGQGANSFEDIAQDDFGNLILVGKFEEHVNSGQQEIWVMSMDTEGDSLWSARYFEPSSIGSSAMDISSLSSNKFLVTGKINEDGFAVKIDGFDGTQNWSNIYQMSTNSILFSGSPNSEESKLLIGGTMSGIAGYSPVLFETNSNGTLINFEEFSSVPLGAITSIEPTIDAGYILTGSSYDLWGQIPNMTGFITKIDTNLEVEWELTFEDSLDQQGATIRQYQDGSYILAGSRKGGMWLRKIIEQPTNSNELAVDYSNIKVYPNPAYDKINIAIPESIRTSNLSIYIYDVMGRIVEKCNLDDKINLMEIEHLARGSYHYTIQNSGCQLINGKIILQ